MRANADRPAPVRAAERRTPRSSTAAVVDERFMAIITAAAHRASAAVSAPTEALPPRIFRRRIRVNCTGAILHCDLTLLGVLRRLNQDCHTEEFAAMCSALRLRAYGWVDGAPVDPGTI
ncbi:hypothetical protein EVAR_27921_1 [Eumeta japonica]|uniref:Uncharacterized protein n=1 Tax=Eumeta variegata TaxID=151549 RepID=A0A4C1UWA9_EUMVA|nr:hypothetical protein EVAR_27921_1 [Eumeta japonica]